MNRMLPLCLTVGLALAPAAFAQEGGESGPRSFFDNLLKEMEPALDDLRGLADDLGPAFRDFAENMGPALGELLDSVEDWSRYEAPEMLPNGDIIIRRKPDPEPEPAPEGPRPNEPIDL